MFPAASSSLGACSIISSAGSRATGAIAAATTAAAAVWCAESYYTLVAVLQLEQW